ncbi:MAG: DNA-3-methyladenine glycosylase, partial [Planctomycetota bacterium]|nr:DNA-3-methyladenine glycosylase [Planctomycetota bacterium]
MMTPRFTAYSPDPVTVARRLLGQRLVRIIDGHRLAGTIVEVEAYLGARDQAAHTYRGRRTARNESMYLAGGHAYVYLTYGMHHCLNVVCGQSGNGVAVLLRALEPTQGIDQMFANRRIANHERDLCSGPAKLTQ